MVLNREFLRIYRNRLINIPSFTTTHMAIIAIMATDPKRVFSGPEMAYMLGLTDQAIRNAMRRLDALDFIGGGLLTYKGLEIAGANDLPEGAPDFVIVP